MKFQMELNIKTFLFCLKLVILIGLLNIHVTANETDVHSNSTSSESSEERYLCDSTNYNKTCCNEGEFQCGNGFCIPREKVCDSLNTTARQPISFGWRMKWIMDRADCSDATDEIGCSGIPCKSRSNSTCPHDCIDLPGNKSRCTCYQGYTLKISASQQTCVDIDECKIGVHLCSHDCINLNGTFACGCKDGFQVNNLTGSCKADDRNIQILYNSDNFIYSYNLTTGIYVELISITSFKDITYDPITEIMYWSVNDKIFRSYIPGAKGGNVTTGLRQMVNMTTFNGKILKNSLSIDWTAGNLYWLSTDALNDSNTQVMVSKLDGRYVKTLCEVPNGLSLVLDPEFGRMYWSSGGTESHIGVSWMNGMFKWVITRLPNQNPISLTLDHLSNGRLYWFDSISNTFFYINKDGTRPTKIKTIVTKFTPVSVDIFEDSIYWVNNVSGSLMRIDKFGRGDIESLVTNLDDPSSVKIYHPRRVNKEIRPGGLYCTNQCSHLCLHVPRGYSCSCPDGNKLISLMGEIVCDNEKEDKHDDPIPCNCEDKESVCNESSIFWNCPCITICPHESDYSNMVWEGTLNFNSTFIIVAVIIVAFVIMFGLSFWKK